MKMFLLFGMVAGAASATTLGYTQAKTHHKCGHSSDRLFRTEGSTAAQCYAKCTTTDGCKHFSVNTTPNTPHFGVCMGCKVGNWEGHSNFGAYNMDANVVKAASATTLGYAQAKTHHERMNVAECKDWTCPQWCKWFDAAAEKAGVYAANGCDEVTDQCLC